jgi:hypothetical protein
MMQEQSTAECCPRFDPEPWDETTFTWDGKLFIKDHVRSFLHIPLNFGGVMKRCAEAIKAADAEADEMIVLSDEKSPWGADVYVAVSKDVPGVNMAAISGTFTSKVFEGPYRDIRKWIQEMKAYVEAQGKELKKMYFYYTTCPKCAKEYGKNYVVILAQV